MQQQLPHLSCELVRTFVVMVPSWFLSNTVKASLKVASSSAVSDSRIFRRSASVKVVIVRFRGLDWVNFFPGLEASSLFAER